MHQEPADKFFVADGDLPFWVTGLFPPCGEGGLCFRYGQDPVVGDGNPVGIPSQIFDRIPETVEGFFDVWAPVFLIKAVFERLPDAGILQSTAGGRKNKFPLLVTGVQKRKIFPLELIPEYPDRDKELSGGAADPAVRSEPCPGDDAVHVDMVAQFLVPGVEHLDDPGLCPEVFFVGRQFQECLRTAFMEQPVKKLLVTEEQGVEFVRERKYHMEVRGANDFRPALVHPEFFADSLTDGTVPVTAGILVEFHVPAFAAFTDIDTQPAGLAGEDGTGSFSLFLGLEMSGLTVIRIGILPDVLDPEVTHGASLPSFQTGWERKKKSGKTDGRKAQWKKPNGAPLTLLKSEDPYRLHNDR